MSVRMRMYVFMWWPEDKLRVVLGVSHWPAVYEAGWAGCQAVQGPCCLCLSSTGTVSVPGQLDCYVGSGLTLRLPYKHFTHHLPQPKCNELLN